MRAKWRIRSRLLIINGHKHRLWIAKTYPSSPAFSWYRDESLMFFGNQPAALAYVLEQLETSALAEATA
tara:strand:- start:9984 stop:10190 length:207 start_codon:yes stop_codon:yes gene_type:complete